MTIVSGRCSFLGAKTFFLNGTWKILILNIGDDTYLIIHNDSHDSEACNFYNNHFPNFLFLQGTQDRFAGFFNCACVARQNQLSFGIDAKRHGIIVIVGSWKTPPRSCASFVTLDEIGWFSPDPPIAPWFFGKENRWKISNMRPDLPLNHDYGEKG